MRHRFPLFFCITVALFFCTFGVSCANNTPPAGLTSVEVNPTQVVNTTIPVVESTSKPIIQINSGDLGVEKRLVFTEPINQNNCGNDSNIAQTIERKLTVTYTAELGGEVTLSMEGVVEGGLPLDVLNAQIKAGSEIAARYGVMYGREEEQTRTLELTTRAGKNQEFLIDHVEYWESGDITISLGSWEEEFGYKFRRGVGLEQSDSSDLGCPGAIAQTPTEINSTLPTETPESPTSVPSTMVVTETIVSSTGVSQFKTLIKNAVFRAGPGITHPLLGYLEMGTEITVIGRDEKASWLNVVIRREDDVPVWVPRSAVELPDAVSTITIAATIPTPPPPADTPIPASTPTPASPPGGGGGNGDTSKPPPKPDD